MIKKYRIYSGEQEIHGTGCYCLKDVEEYCRMFRGLHFTEEDFPEPPKDAWYFVYENAYHAQVGRYL